VTARDDDTTGSLRSVADKVAELESALVGKSLKTGAPLADELVAMTTELLDALDLDPNPDPDRDAELISTLRVYRNAAFVFRRLAGASGEPDPELAALCAALIGQGHDHLVAFMSQAPQEDESTA
jgi:hypothetical protein